MSLNVIPSQNAGEARPQPERAAARVAPGRRAEGKANLYDLTLEGLEALMGELGQKPYRARQVWQALYRRLVTSIDEMTDLPADLRAELSKKTEIRTLEPIRQQVAEDGHTTKVQLRLPGGGMIESVLMWYPPSATNNGRYTVCVSTQVGCAVGCPFCATGKMGFISNLTAGEVVAQVLYFARQQAIDNLVFMGMGEPMLNYANMWQAVETLNSPLGFGMGARRFTISTSGILPGIRKLAEEKLLVNLAISLHAPNDTLRQQLVPIDKKYPLADLMDACDAYTERTGRRVSYEYVMLAGVNDSPELAHELAQLLTGRLAHVNLIPWNPTSGSFNRPSGNAIARFQTVLHQYGVRTTIRAEKGVEISAACGQLVTQGR